MPIFPLAGGVRRIVRRTQPLWCRVLSRAWVAERWQLMTTDCRLPLPGLASASTFADVLECGHEGGPPAARRRRVVGDAVPRRGLHGGPPGRRAGRAGRYRTARERRLVDHRQLGRRPRGDELPAL